MSYGYIYRDPKHLMVGVDYDCQDKMVYWTDIVSKTIQRSSYDGSNMEVLIKGLQDPQGKVFVEISFKIYKNVIVSELRSSVGENLRCEGVVVSWCNPAVSWFQENIVVRVGFQPR